MSLFKPSQQQISQVQLPQHPVPYRSNNIAVSVAIQTDYRETEVQTDPWTAPVNPSTDIPENQEIKDLIELTIQNGLLPAHEGTMEVIRRIKEQKEFDANIPPPLDPTRQPTEQELKQDAIRTQMLIERDLREWDRKEKELAKYHQLRIKILIDKLSEREQARQDLRDELLDKLTANKQHDVERQISKLNKQAVLQLKKSVAGLNQSIENQNNFNNQCDYSSRIVKTNFRNEPVLSLPQQKSTVRLVNNCIFNANQLNAPVLKPGEAPYRFAGVIKLAGTELKSQQDFEEIMQYYDQNNGQVSERLYKPHRPTFKNQKNYAVHKENGYLPIPSRKNVEKGELSKEEIIRRLEQLENQESSQNQNLYLQQQQQQQELINKTSNSTQIYRQFDKCPDISNSRQNDAYLQLQNLIRGRATQVNMQQGKDRRIGLVTELRLAHSLVEIRGQDQNLQKLAQDRLEMVKEAIMAGSVTNGVSQIVGQSIDQLQKERIRSQQMLRTEAILQIALRERQRRELLETDQRQKEVMQRSRKDYNRKVIQEAHREFVDMLIGRISKKSQDKEAETQAQDLAMRQVEAIVEQDYQNSKEGAKTGYQEQLRDYLRDFLLPEVDRKYQAATMLKDQQKWFFAGLVAKEAGFSADKKLTEGKGGETKGTETEVNADGVLKVDGEEVTEHFKGVEAESKAISDKINKQGKGEK